MRRPVHIQLPSDITHLQIKVPKQPLDLSRPQSDPKLLQETATRIAKRIKQARQPVLLIDNEAEIFQLPICCKIGLSACRFPIPACLLPKIS